ncbi:MAG: hypothetical protein ACPGWR_15450 [Ardenticatenaceae bacterium]
MNKQGCVFYLSLPILVPNEEILRCALEGCVFYLSLPELLSRYIIASINV